MTWPAARCDELVRLWTRPDLTVERIAEMLGVSHSAAKGRAARMRLPPRPARTAQPAAKADQ